MKNKTITIVGIGILGGSYAMGLRRAGNIVYGIDILQESIDFALENEYISEGSIDDYSHYLKKSDIIILCLYPNTLIQWIKDNGHLINKDAIVTDVCGVKQGIVEEVQSALEPYGIEFYASHPMRGKESLGVRHADASIFRDANIILVPTSKNTERGEETIRKLAYTLGFTSVSKLTAFEHDRMIGYLSQLTHAIAVSLMTANSDEGLEKYSGDSFKDLTRIAKIDENLWSELFVWNKEILCDEIDIFVENLQALRNHIHDENFDGMKDMFRLSTNRRKLFDE